MLRADPLLHQSPCVARRHAGLKRLRAPFCMRKALKWAVLGFSDLDIVDMVAQPVLLVTMIAVLGSLAPPSPTSHTLLYIQPRARA